MNMFKSATNFSRANRRLLAKGFTIGLAVFASGCLYYLLKKTSTKKDDDSDSDRALLELGKKIQNERETKRLKKEAKAAALAESSQMAREKEAADLERKTEQERLIKEQTFTFFLNRWEKHCRQKQTRTARKIGDICKQEIRQYYIDWSPKAKREGKKKIVIADVAPTAEQSKKPNASSSSTKADREITNSENKEVTRNQKKTTKHSFPSKEHKWFQKSNNPGKRSSMALVPYPKHTFYPSLLGTEGYTRETIVKNLDRFPSWISQTSPFAVSVSCANYAMRSTRGRMGCAPICFGDAWQWLRNDLPQLAESQYYPRLIQIEVVSGLNFVIETEKITLDVTVDKLVPVKDANIYELLACYSPEPNQAEGQIDLLFDYMDLLIKPKTPEDSTPYRVNPQLSVVPITLRWRPIYKWTQKYMGGLLTWHTVGTADPSSITHCTLVPWKRKGTTLEIIGGQTTDDLLEKNSRNKNLNTESFGDLIDLELDSRPLPLEYLAQDEDV